MPEEADGPEKSAKMARIVKKGRGADLRILKNGNSYQ
jgi:hypothetical protein